VSDVPLGLLSKQPPKTRNDCYSGLRTEAANLVEDVREAAAAQDWMASAIARFHVLRYGLGDVPADESHSS
jgi:hypothetical protein